MTSRVYDLAILVAVWGAYARVACVLLASARTFRNRRRFVTFKMGAAEMAAEAMMIGAFGETYRAYQRAVPFLVPRLSGRARSAQAARA